MKRSLQLFFLLLSVTLFAVELERGHTYSGPLKLTAKSLGVGLGLLNTWRAELPKSGGMQLSREASAIRIDIHAQEFEPHDAIDYLSLPVQFRSTLMLYPEKRIIRLSATKYRRSFNVSGGKESALLYIVLGPQRRAAVLTGVAPAEELTAMRNSMLSIANTITFTQIKPPAEMAGSLRKKITGGHYIYYESVDGHNEKREIWLCSEGKFVLKGARAIASNTSTISTTYQGRWLVKKEDLILQFVDGSQTSITLRQVDSALFFGEQRTYPMKNGVCR